jgi:hypothetical protein
MQHTLYGSQYVSSFAKEAQEVRNSLRDYDYEIKTTFGFPVLPLVYKRNSGSSASTHSTSHLVGKSGTTSYRTSSFIQK